MTEHRALIADGATQFDFQKAPMPDTPNWLFDLARLLGKYPGLLQTLFYLALAIGVLIILWQIGLALSPRLRRPGGAAVAVADPGWLPEAAGARLLLAEADALAAAGDHAEAVHLLLLRSVEEIDARHPGALRPSWTSRDIAALPLLSAASASAFATIAGIVETGLFAQRPVGAEDWQRCRSAYAQAAFGGVAGVRP